MKNNEVECTTLVLHYYSSVSSTLPYILRITRSILRTTELVRYRPRQRTNATTMSTNIFHCAAILRRRPKRRTVCGCRACRAELVQSCLRGWRVNAARMASFLGKELSKFDVADYDGAKSKLHDKKKEIDQLMTCSHSYEILCRWRVFRRQRHVKVLHPHQILSSCYHDSSS